MRISFSSPFRDMTYNYYLKQPRPMCEIRLNQIIAKNPRHIYHLKRFSNHPFIRKYTNQEMKIVYERNLNLCLIYNKKMKIDTKLFEDYVNFVDTKTKQNTYYKTFMFSVTISVSLLSLYLLNKYLNE